jgi:DNA polymerase-3 subunit gamma/tau
MEVLYRKWRPQTLADVVGQEHVTRTLLNALKSDKVAHAYLFCGPRGTGKTSTGRILAKALNCSQGGAGEPCNACILCKEITGGHAMDVVEIDAASNRGIDEIRELRERVRFAPGTAKCKFYIIDEVHMLTEPAANALLKTLEEPPPHVRFVLATTEPHKVPVTILSRCQRFDFRRISQDATMKRLKEIGKGEGIKIDDASLKLIARSATGSLRDAINLLEQLTAYYGNDVSLPQVQAMLGITGDVRARELVNHIVNNDIPAGLHTINSVTQDGVDLRQFARELVEYLRELLLVKAGAAEAVDVSKDAIAELKQLADKASMAQLSQAVRRFREVEMGFDGFSPLPLELALVECAMPSDRSALLEKLEKATGPAGAKPASAAAPTAAKPTTVTVPTPAKPTATAKVETEQEPTAIAPATPKRTDMASKEKKAEGATAETSATAKAEKASEPAATVPATPVKTAKVAKDEKAIEPTVSATPTPERAAKAITDEKAESAAPPTPAEPAPAAKDKSLEDLRRRWKEVVNATKGMGSRGNLDALLRSACEPIEVTSDTLVLGFYYDFHKEKIEDPKYRTMVEAKVLEVFGRPYKIRCVITEKKDKKAKGHLVDKALQMGATLIEEE